MATAQHLLDAGELIRASGAALGEALASVATYAPPALARAVQAEQNLHLRAGLFLKDLMYSFATAAGSKNLQKGSLHPFQSL